MTKVLLIGLMAAVLSNGQTEIRRAPVLPSYKNLKFPPLPPIKIPEPATLTLSNGMKIYLLESHELPIVSGFALVRTGNLFDPANKRGLAGITGEVMRAGGTKSKTGDEIDVELENIAASVESQIGESSGTVSFSALRENTDEVMGVFKDVLTSPGFRQDKLDLAKTQTRSSIARRNDDPHGIAAREFANLLYGKNTPYGWDIEYADIDNIQRQDLVDFYQRYYFPANIMLAVYGDFSTVEMKEKLTQLFGEWNAKQPPVPKFPQVQKTPVPGAFLATKDDVTQTFFEVGHLGGILIDKDYPALEVAADILGGGFSSRLFQRIRTKLGYAYSIGSSWGANYDHPGLFQIFGSTQSMHTVDTLKAIREELDRIRTTEISDDELKIAKDTVLNGFVFHFDRPSKTLNRVVLYEYYGYPKDFVFRYQKAIESVTKQDVLRVAKTYFRPEDLTIVAVGNPKDFKTPISVLNLKVEPIDLTIPEPKKETPKADSASLEKGKQLLHRMQQALGGANKLGTIKDAEYHANVTIQAGGNGMSVKQRNAFLLPSTLRQDLELPFGKQSVFFDGKGGWMASPQGTQNLPPPLIKQVKGELFRELFALALSDRDPERAVSALSDNTIEISDSHGNSARVQLDPSGLPQTLEYTEAGQSGPVKVEETYSDWRDVNGIKAPFKVTVLQDRKKFADAIIQDYKLNSGLTEEQLSKKP